MTAPVPTASHELQAVLAKYDQEFDEPATIHFLAKVREKGILGDNDWQQLLQWLDAAMKSLQEPVSQETGGPLIVDDDPRDADWIRIVRAQRLAGYRLPHWATLWLWWIGHDRGEEYWRLVGDVAKIMGFPPFVPA